MEKEGGRYNQKRKRRAESGLGRGVDAVRFGKRKSLTFGRSYLKFLGLGIPEGKRSRHKRRKFLIITTGENGRVKRKRKRKRAATRKRLFRKRNKVTPNTNEGEGNTTFSKIYEKSRM